MEYEIKEILKDIDNEECYYVGTTGCLYQDLDKGQLLCIKNYITNLQQDYKSRCETAIEYIEEKMELRKESPNDLLNILRGNNNDNLC